MFNTYLKQLKTLKQDVTVIPGLPFSVHNFWLYSWNHGLHRNAQCIL